MTLKLVSINLLLSVLLFNYNLVIFSDFSFGESEIVSQKDQLKHINKFLTANLDTENMLYNKNIIQIYIYISINPTGKS